MRGGRGRAAGPGRRTARRMTVRRMMRRRRRRRRRRVILAGGLIAFGAYKLTKKDADRVEEYTGKSAEDLSDEELDQAMDHLNIPKEELTDEEYDYAEAADPDVPEDDYIDQLERLGQLHDQGILTDEEFNTKKAEILAQM